jgi:hypothetical protein
MLISGQAANCRQVEAQSGRAADLAVHHRRHHLALQSAEG